jgi:hypothetical protein
VETAALGGGGLGRLRPGKAAVWAAVVWRGAATAWVAAACYGGGLRGGYQGAAARARVRVAEAKKNQALITISEEMDCSTIRCLY